MIELIIIVLTPAMDVYKIKVKGGFSTFDECNHFYDNKSETMIDSLKIEVDEKSYSCVIPDTISI